MDRRKICIVIEGVCRACLLGVLLAPVSTPLRACIDEKIAGITATATAAACSTADIADFGAVLLHSAFRLLLTLDSPATCSCSLTLVRRPPERRQSSFGSHLLILLDQLQRIRERLGRLVWHGQQGIDLCQRQGRQRRRKTVALALDKEDVVGAT